MNLFYRYYTWQFSWNFHPLQVISIHYKSRIATGIRGLGEDHIVNSELKGIIGIDLYPSVHEQLTQCWLNADPSSTTLAQH